MKTVLVTTEQVTRSMRAPRATRVLVTRPDGLAPQVNIPAGGVLRGVWLGGFSSTLKPGALTEIQIGADVVIENCVIFGYTEGVNVAGGKRAVLRNNLFVHCGHAHYSHPIYINDMTAQEGEGTRVEGNIFLGCEGYSIHLWHNPPYNSIQQNFIAHAFGGIAQQGHHNTFRDNVVWSNSSPTPSIAGFSCPSAYLADGANLNFSHNLFGRDTRNALLETDADALIRNNGFFEGRGCAPFGTSPQVYSARNLKLMLGMSRVQIDEVIASVLAVFGQGVNALLEDETILPNAEKLRAAVNAWANEKAR